MKHLLVATLSVMAFAGIGLWGVWSLQADDGALRVCAVRGPLGLELVNHEAAPLRDCRARISGAGGTCWIATLEADVPAGGTAMWPWAAFQDGALTLPASRRNAPVTVTCEVMGRGERRAVIGR